MKILHLRASEFFGGPERAIIGQCLSLKGFDFLCGSFIRKGARNDFLNKCRGVGLKTVEISESFPGDIRVIKQIRKIISDNNISLVITHDYKSNFYCHRAIKGIDVKQISHFRGRTTEDTKVKLYNFIDWQILRKIPKIITVSDASKKLLVSKGVRPERIHVVFNAINCDNFTAEDTDNRDTGGRLKMVAAGRLSYEKGYDILLKALAAIRGETAEFELSIYGHGPEEAKLRDMTDRLGLADMVRFCGFVDNIIPVFRDSDLLVLPSRSEGMPNVILEAWSQRLPVLAAAVGAVPDMLGNNDEYGLVVQPDNVESLAHRLIFALKNRKELKILGQRGFEKVRREYSFEKQAELLQAIYLEYLGVKSV